MEAYLNKRINYYKMRIRIAQDEGDSKKELRHAAILDELRTALKVCQEEK